MGVQDKRDNTNKGDYRKVIKSERRQIAKIALCGAETSTSDTIHSLFRNDRSNPSLRITSVSFPLSPTLYSICIISTIRIIINKQYNHV